MIRSFGSEGELPDKAKKAISAQGRSIVFPIVSITLPSSSKLKVILDDGCIKS